MKYFLSLAQLISISSLAAAQTSDSSSLALISPSSILPAVLSSSVLPAVLSSSVLPAVLSSSSSVPFSLIPFPTVVPLSVSASSSIRSLASSVSSAPAGSVTGTTTSTASSAGASSSSAAGAGPVCPGDNGKTFTATTAGGPVPFTITCGTGTVGKVRRSIGSVAKRQAPVGLNAFGICITSCANTPNCQSLLFNPVNGACALYDCIVTVPAGLSGATRVGASTVCPPDTPTSVPVINNNINLNLNISIAVNIKLDAGVFQGLPYTQICTLASCSPCVGATPAPLPSCSICYGPGAPPPMSPPTNFYPPGVPGQPGYPGTCSTCGYAPVPVGPVPVPPKPVGPACGGANCTAPYPYGGSSSSSSSSNANANSNSYASSNANSNANSNAQACSGTSCSGKYTGPYSNDASGIKVVGSLLGAVVALAFALA